MADTAAHLVDRVLPKVPVRQWVLSLPVALRYPAAALYYYAYNFIKIHGTLRTTPAMAAGVTNKLWEVSDLVALWEQYEERREERAA